MDSTTPDPQPTQQPQPQQQQQKQQPQSQQPKPQPQPPQQQPHQHQHLHPHPHPHPHQHQHQPAQPAQAAYPLPAHYPYYTRGPYPSYVPYTQPFPYGPAYQTTWGPNYAPAQAHQLNMVNPQPQSNVPHQHNKPSPTIINPVTNADRPHNQAASITSQAGAKKPRKKAILRDPETMEEIPLENAPSTNSSPSIPKESPNAVTATAPTESVHVVALLQKVSEPTNNSPKVEEVNGKNDETEENGQDSNNDDTDADSTTALQNAPEPNNPILDGEDKKDSEPTNNSPKVEEVNEKNDEAEENGQDSNNDDTDADSTTALQYAPGQYNPISNREGKKVYSIDFLKDVCEKVCNLRITHPQDDDKIDSGGDETPCAFSSETRVDMFAPSFSSNNQRFPLNNRQNEQARRQNQNNYAGRSSGGQERQRKVITSASLTQEVELKTTSNPWRPAKEIKEDTPVDVAETENLKKKFRSILNKLTPNNFENLSKSVTELNIDTESRLGEMIDIVFAKALAEPGYCVLYGKMCNHLMTITAGTANFGNILLKRCQQQFQADIYSGCNIDEREEKINNEQDPEMKKQLTEELYEDKYRCRVRSLGLIKFIGELYKINMLNDTIMLDCISRLLNDPTEESLECLCDLLATIGEKLDRSTKGNPENQKKAKGNQKPASNQPTKTMAAALMGQQQKAADEVESFQLTNLDQVFERFHKIRKNLDLPLSVRIRFKLQDTCELREKYSWTSNKTKDNNPKTLEEIREAHKEKVEQERRQVAMGPRRSQEGRRILGHPSGSSSQISSLANESSSHSYRDYPSGDNTKSNHNDIEEHQKKKQNLSHIITNISRTDKTTNDSSLRPNYLKKPSGAM